MNEQEMSMREAMELFAQRVPLEAPNTFSGQMTPVLVDCDAQAKMVTYSFATQPWMRNPGGAVHGGVIAEALSMTMNALAWYYAGMKHNPAISIQISYPRPALVGQPMLVRATAVHAGKNMAYIAVQAWQGDREDKPFAAGSGVNYTAAAQEEE